MTLSFVIMTLAVARLTRLITTDVLFEVPRGWFVRKLIEHDGPPSEIRAKLAYLIVCDWCASVYVGAVGAGAWYAWHGTMPFMVITAALAASYVTGFLTSVTEE
ncbi:MAG TPA: DUF1360 domain-containing protein [Pyrinomonadaceae bacterium]|nr:DUF1360 domain-containing protein [Pyrinomonadaceae bacterium]